MIQRLKTRRPLKSTLATILPNAVEDSDKEECTIAPPKRGRPRKDGGKVAEETASINIPVYVEIAVPPKLKPGKTYKGTGAEDGRSVLRDSRNVSSTSSLAIER
jgi:hypothetical protein